MKNRVIPNAVRDLSRGHGLHKLRRVIRASWVRSLALLGMTVWFAWLLLPKPPLLEGISFSQCVRDRDGKLLRVTLSDLVLGEQFQEPVNLPYGIEKFS